LSKWTPHFTNRYKREYKRLASKLQERVDDGLAELVQSEYPRRLGDHKIHNLDCIYAYDIGLQYRILYGVSDEQRAIVLYRVGPHSIYD
jgi:addiction module RelE/StbE family toxin